MTELKPCPFCGSSDLHIYVMQDGIRCNNCGAKFTDCEDWMERWNRRASE